MGLKELTADLENFKYGISSPDKIDGQIESGVDFFDDVEGGAIGFTTQAEGNLLSQYNKFIEGPVVGPNAGVRSNMKTRTAYGTFGEYEEEGNPGLSDPSHILSTDTFGSPWSPDFPQFQSSFMDTPIAGYISQYPLDPSVTWDAEDGTMNPDSGKGAISGFPPNYYATLSPIEDRVSMWRKESGGYTFNLLGTVPPNNDNIQVPYKEYPDFGKFTDNHITLYSIPDLEGGNYGIKNQPAGHSYSSPFQPLPPYDFMTTPISDAVSRYPTNPSATWGNEDGAMTGPVAGNPPTHELRRGVYNEYPLGEFLQFGNRSDENRIYGKPESVAAGYFPSVHISKAGQFNAGVRYGALTGQDFIVYNPDTPINDVKATPWSIEFPQFQDPFLSVLANHQSRFAIGSDGTWSIPDPHPVSTTWDIDNVWTGDVYIPNYVDRVGTLTGIDAPWPDAAPTTDVMGVLANHNSRYVTGNVTDGFNVSSDFYSQPISLTWGVDNDPNTSGNVGALVSGNPSTDSGTAGNQPSFLAGQTLAKLHGVKGVAGGPQSKGQYIDNDKLRYGGKDYTEVPSGPNDEGLFGTSTFREIADPENFQLFRQPFILREMGNQWGIDNIQSEGVGGFFGGAVNLVDSVAGGFVRGAPTFSGLVSRNIHDKFRIGKFLLTGQGITFLAKQFALQALNPTLESKIYNPLSVLGLVGAGDAWEGLMDTFEGNPLQNMQFLTAGAADLALSATLPIGHPERHLGGIRYEEVNPLKELKSNDGGIGEKIASIPIIGGRVLDAINSKIADLGEFSRLGAIAQGFKFSFLGMETVLPGGQFTDTEGEARMNLINPNKYLFPISSAPKSVGKDGSIAFMGGQEWAKADGLKIQNTKGGTFNKKTSVQKANEGSLIKRHSTLSYKHLGTTKYEEVLASPNELNAEVPDDITDLELDRGYYRRRGFGQSANIGSQGAILDPELIKSGRESHVAHNWDKDHGSEGDADWVSAITDLDILDRLRVDTTFSTAGDIDAMNSAGKVNSHNEWGVIKGNAKSPNVDKVNILPYGADDDGFMPNKVGGTEVDDFIKFRFFDVVGKKWIIFRAILDSIQDSVSPEYGEERYIGRPDKVYVYQGTDRSVSFNLKIYPKTKQEFPVLLEKLNYLVGLCYPSYTKSERMVTPFITLTIGDMFTDAPGLLESLNVTVDDSSTWEIQEGLQFPHFISVACQFKYIGQHILASTGKHYNLGWLPDGSQNRFGGDDLGFDKYPNRQNLGLNGSGEGGIRKFWKTMGQTKYGEQFETEL